MQARQKILIIDDQDPVIETTSRILVRAGYKVLSSKTIICADLIQREQPDLILLDVEMPGLGGEVAADIFTKERAAIRGKIVFHSARDPAELRKLALRSRIDGFIAKSGNLEEFLQSVQSFIPREAPDSSLSSKRPPVPGELAAKRSLSTPDNPPVRPPAPATPPAVPGVGPRHIGHVVLVDPDEAMTCFLKIALISMGVRVHTTHGPQFTEVLMRKCPDVVILSRNAADVPLSRVRSFLQDLPGLGRIKILYLAEEGAVGVAAQVREIGLDGFVMKSTNWGQVAREIRDSVLRLTVGSPRP